jgi:hypothetical protein
MGDYRTGRVTICTAGADYDLSVDGLANIAATDRTRRWTGFMQAGVYPSDPNRSCTIAGKRCGIVVYD